MDGAIHAQMQWENVTFHQQAIEAIDCSQIKNYGKTVKYFNKKIFFGHLFFKLIKTQHFIACISGQAVPAEYEKISRKINSVIFLS